MNKVSLVAKREYLTTVRRKGFIIATLGMPVFFMLLFGIIGGVGLLTARASKNKAETLGIVDQSGLIKFSLLDKVRSLMPSTAAQATERIPPMFRDPIQREISKLTSNLQFRRFASRAEASSAYLRKEVSGYYVIPPNFLNTGEIQLEIRKAGFMSEERPGWNVIQRLAQASLVDGKLEDPLAQRLWVPARLKSVILTETGQPDKGGQLAQITTFAVPYFFTIFFMISIMSSAGYLLQSVVEEKENRVIEILLSSVTPEQLLAGKVLGLCGAGLTQISVWAIIGVSPALYLLPFLELRWSQLLVALVFFLLGFLLFGTLMGGFGSLGNNFRESQQMSIVWSMSAVTPMFFMVALLAQPNGTLARVLSYIPLTAPVTMMLRNSAARVPWWDITLSAGILMASLFLFVRLGAKMFHLGVLLYGKRPTLVEIVRWIKAA